MTEKVRLKLPPHVANVIRPEAPREQRMKAARGEIPVAAGDLTISLVLLARDADGDIRSAAVDTLRTLSEGIVAEVVSSSNTHPKVLHVLARLHGGNGQIARLLSCHPLVEEETLQFLRQIHPCLDSENVLAPGDLSSSPAVQEMQDPQEEPDGEESDEFRSKYQLAQEMGIAEKIKFALTGDKEWRSLLIKDSNKMVSGSVMKNPRITDQEILTIAKSTMVNEETVRLICANKDWVKNYLIRKALAENPKTPLPVALRFLSTLSEKDLAMMAKSKNISSVIATQARKALAVIQKRR